MKLAPALIIGAIFATAATVIAFAQTDILASLTGPVVVNIAQEVPVDVTLALPQSDGATLTTTVPLTVGIALQVKISGAGVVDVTLAGEPAPAAINAGQEESAAPSAPEGQLIDASGIPYQVQSPDGLVVLQSVMKTTILGTELNGQLENQSATDFRFVTLSIALYDADNVLIDVVSAYGASSELVAGKKTTFSSISIDAPLESIARYEIQVEGDVP